jgi:hypothetical protein
MGALAADLGVTGLAEALSTSTRTLNNWANNVSAISGIEAGLLADLCRERGVTPMLYTHPNLPNGYVANTSEGWVMWGFGLDTYGYPSRRRYRGHLVGLVPADAGVLVSARTHGWPW